VRWWDSVGRQIRLRSVRLQTLVLLCWRSLKRRHPGSRGDDRLESEQESGGHTMQACVFFVRVTTGHVRE
jgi:hypothetical protein